MLRSLDRKVCNTLNVCCIPEEQAPQLVPALLAGLQAAGDKLGQPYRLHVVDGHQKHVPSELFERKVDVTRAEGIVSELQADLIPEAQLATEWEWEQTPEVSLAVVPSVDQAVALFNAHSPHFVASLISPDAAKHRRFFQGVDAPFVGDTYTRWVDGQFALKKPELGLTNWQEGRLFGRGGILAGDGVFTVRTRYVTA